MHDGNLPLTGIRVLDFGHTIMGPCAGLLLADMGADVIKIEPPGGDPTRRLPGFATGFFATFNRNKRSIAIDLKHPDGKAIARDLVATADVMLENFGPGTIDRLGLGWEEVRALNPRLIFLALKGFLSGPYENRGALDEVVQMQSGLAYMTGPPGRPLRVGAPIIDIMGALFGVLAVMAALRERDRTGKGQRVASSLFETAAFMMGPHIAGSAIRGEPIPPMPARRSAWGVYDVFAARDGEQVFIGITSDAQWQRFCVEFDAAGLGSDERLASNESRSANRQWLIPALTERFASLPLEEILRRCERAVLPFARVGKPHELLDDSHLAQLGALVATQLSAVDGDGQTVGLPSLPIEYGDGRDRFGLARQPPRIGEHSKELLRDLGVSDADVDSLRTRGVIVC